MGARVRLAAAAVIVAMTAPAHAAAIERGAYGLYAGGKPLPVIASSIDLHVDGPFADGTVTQRFRNPLDQPIEAVYVFPLPDDAAVSSMVIRTGSRTIVAKIEDRGAARQRYEAAVAAGANAALLEEERADVFTQAVTGIAPGAEITVELRFDTTIKRTAGRWELALPLVVGPRYAPGAATGAPSTGTGYAPDTDRAPDASRVTPETSDTGVPAAIHVKIDARAAIEDVEVPTHDASVQLHAKTADIALKDARSDHDLVVRWRTKGDAITAVTDQAGFVAIVVPAPAAAKAQPRDWIIVADTSKSTTGDGIVLVRRATRAFLDHVGAKDRVAIAGAVKLGSVAKARAWADAIAANGGSDLAAQLEAARTAAKGARRPVIVLVTDGLVADDKELYQLADQGPAILAIGVGAAPNRGLLDGLAARTGGAARYLAAADDADDAATALIAQADAPRAAATSIAWGGLVTDALPAQLPAMAPGDAAIVIAKVDQPRKARVAVAARSLDLPAIWDTQPARKDDVAPASVIARRWARAKLDALVASGASSDEIRTLGTRYGIVTPETALVAVGTDVVVKGGVTTSVSIPVAMPAGMKWQAVFGTEGDVRDHYREKDKGKDKAEHEKDGKEATTQKPPADTTVTSNPNGATVTVTGRAPSPNQGGEAGRGESTGADNDGGGADDEELAKAPAPPPEVATAEPVYDTAEEVMVLGGASSFSEHRWGLSLTLGAGALVQPSTDAFGIGSLRVTRGLTPRLGIGFDLTVLAAPQADRDRVAVALMAALLRGGLFDNRITLHLGFGPELSSDPGLGYELGARYGLGRVGFVLRWDGAVLVGNDQTTTRGGASAAVQVDF
ncbi:MAG TPA: VIT domain-containing protein [Kofleriaceae bacterium]|nr:VIT domain-containing protein [Kofleriaceae bacterium]